MPPKFLPADLKRERNKFRIAPFAGAFDLEMSNFFRDLNRELVPRIAENLRWNQLRALGSGLVIEK